MRGKAFETDIVLVRCENLSKEIIEYLLDTYDYGGHYDHTVIFLYDDGNIFAEWLKENGYEFKNDRIRGDMIALFGT